MHRNSAALLSLVLSLLVAACERSAAPAPTAPAPPSAKSVEPAAASGQGAKAGAPAAIDEALARNVLTRWLEAQNAGDFAAYQALYATRMYGEKRAGSRTYTFDRKGWLADRARMFEKPMSVAVEDTQVHSDALTATLTFVQTFRQGNFNDRGPKRMTLVREGDALRISTEIMESSTLAKQHAQLAEHFYFVVKIAGKSYAVLQQGVPHAYGRGEPSAPVRDPETGTWVTLQDVGTLPAPASALRSSPLRVYDARGASCEATVKELKLMAAVIPHFGTVMSWEGSVNAQGESVPEGKRVPTEPAIIARALMEEVNAEHLSLVGELSSCEGVFATAPDRKVTVFAPEQPDADTRSRAEAALRALPGYKRSRADYQKAMREIGEAAAEDWPLETDVRGFGPGARFVAVGARRRGGCSEYEDSLTAILRHEGDELTPVVSARHAEVPWMVIDLDDDGVLELITGSQHLAERQLERFERDAPEIVSIVPVSFHDCGC